MERWGEPALGAYIQFLSVHMQFYLLNEAESEVRLVATQDTYQHCLEKLCVFMKIGDKLLSRKVYFGCRTLQQN